MKGSNMGMRKTTRLDGAKVVVLTQIQLEIPEDKYDDFLQKLEREEKVDVELQDSNGLNYKVTVFKGEHWD